MLYPQSSASTDSGAFQCCVPRWFSNSLFAQVQHFSKLMVLTDGLPLFKGGDEGTLALHKRQMALLWRGALSGRRTNQTTCSNRKASARYVFPSTLRVPLLFLKCLQPGFCFEVGLLLHSSANILGLSCWQIFLLWLLQFSTLWDLEALL